MITSEQIKSAQITADAQEKIVSIFVEVETENSCGGKISHALNVSKVCKKPFVVLASVLPFTYGFL